ncbi:MAG: ATP-dependent Clp protease adaptor ClpS [Bacteroidales bacterium]|nr:ATP-dependent Clp protease adaptor ClpS [Bacteroidales bacterium]
MSRKKQYYEEPFIEEILGSDIGLDRSLVLHNDDVHTFDYVIDSLIAVCEHDSLQAEQCTYLVHYKGKCDVKSGSFSALKPMKEGLVERGLKATIN